MERVNEVQVPHGCPESRSAEEAKLNRVPEDFDRGFPYTDDFRFKSFVAGRPLTQRSVTSADLVQGFRAGQAFGTFLRNAMGLPHRARGNILSKAADEQDRVG